MQPHDFERCRRSITVSDRTDLSRRDLFRASLAVPLTGMLRPRLQAHAQLSLARAPWRVVGSEGAAALTVTRTWSDGTRRCLSTLANHTSRPVAVTEVVLFDLDVRGLPATTPIYGEGFQMLSQNGGTLGQPADIGSYTDAKHYKLAMPPGTSTFFGLMRLGGNVLGFTSCRRFSGMFRLHPSSSLQIAVDTEGLTIRPGETWKLEELAHEAAADALHRVADRIRMNHPIPLPSRPPTGWCSWYCFGPRVTAQNILDNLDAIQRKIPGLKYIQIDDGYQAAMGDWLETGAAFGGDLRKVLDTIRQRGFQPAIWVAPFIAEEKSHVFQQHRDWFVKDADGSPLRSDKVTFGGWRHGPWYVLDGTHPDVQAHFEHVFRTMNREWGVTYFKLDANFWGAIQGGRFHDRQATRVEAYRRGMQAILRGAGESFLLGCNHPIWPSLGLIHGSRSSNDIKRTWDRIKTTAQQNLLRNWQNGQLWWNDPDAICLSGDLPDNEFLFHATAIYATGGMLLSGDDLSTLPDARLAILKRLLPPTGLAAIFDDDNLRIGTVRLPGKTMRCCFNWSDIPVTVTRGLDAPTRVTDFWTGASLGVMDNRLTLENMPPRSARLLECVDG
jgi:alpha-galactosidase